MHQNARKAAVTAALSQYAMADLGGLGHLFKFQSHNRLYFAKENLSRQHVAGEDCFATSITLFSNYNFKEMFAGHIMCLEKPKYTFKRRWE